MNPASGDSTGSIGLKKIRLVYLLDLSEGRGEIGAVQFSVGGTPLDEWANGGNVDVLFTCGECGFSSFGSWSCSEEMGLSDKKYVALF